MDIFTWNDDFLNFDLLIKSESDTRLNTFKIDNAINNIIINFINIFFRSSYFLRESYEENSLDHTFWSHAELTYQRVPYTLRNIQVSWQSGYYLESLIIFRHFWECFATLLYFNDKRDKFKKHLNPRDRFRVTFKDIFDTYSPTLHDFYGHLFSNIAHGKLATMFFRVDYSNPEHPRSIMGSEYSGLFSRLTFIPTLTIAYGYLNKISKIFPSFLSKADARLLDNINVLVTHLETNLLNDSKNDFINHVKTMVE